MLKLSDYIKSEYPHFSETCVKLSKENPIIFMLDTFSCIYLIARQVGFREIHQDETVEGSLRDLDDWLRERGELQKAGILLYNRPAI